MVEVFTKEPFSTRELVVHAPHAFSPKSPQSLIDISSPDPNIRKNSIKTIEKALELVSDMDARYLVTHPGGISRKPIPKEPLCSSLLESLEELDSKRILLENMPWFYWIREDRWVSNILIFAQEFERFLPHCGGICLDFCHAFLSQPQGSPETILDFFRLYPDRLRHFHVSDATSPDGEGLQIEDGEFDFPALFLEVGGILGSLKAWAGSSPAYSMIPEIKGGHVDKSRIQKEAFSKLRAVLENAGWCLVE